MSPFRANHVKVDLLRKKMDRLRIRESDLEEKFVRSKGAGGQNVNKVSTCVCLKHIPTGIEVKVQQERSQALNRLLARQLLIEKLEEERQRRLATERQKIAKLHRQKRRRPQYVQEKILSSKRRHSLKKKLRGPIRRYEDD